MDRTLRNCSNEADAYRLRLRTGEPEPEDGPWITRVFAAKWRATSNGKKYFHVKFKTLGGRTFEVRYWLHSHWFNQRLEQLLEQDTWFWVIKTMKISRNDSQFADYRFKRID